MANTDIDKKIRGIITYKQVQHQEKTTDILKAIAILRKRVYQGKLKKITVAEVAREAKVSPGTIYNNPPLLERIRQAASVKALGESGSKEKANNNLKEQILIERIDRMKEEITQLKKENALLLGNLEQKTAECLDWKNRYYELENNRKTVVSI